MIDSKKSILTVKEKHKFVYLISLKTKDERMIVLYMQIKISHLATNKIRETKITKKG